MTKLVIVDYPETHNVLWGAEILKISMQENNLHVVLRLHMLNHSCVMQFLAFVGFSDWIGDRNFFGGHI